MANQHPSGWFTFEKSEDAGQDDMDFATSQTFYYNCRMLTDITGTTIKTGDRVKEITVDYADCWMMFRKNKTDTDHFEQCNFKIKLELL